MSPAAQTSAKLQTIQKDLQQIAAMAGFVNSALDYPQLRLFFTLYGRILAADEAAGIQATPRLRAWAEGLGEALRQNSSSAILPPQVAIASPQPLPSGDGCLVVATVTFSTKVTENSYQRVRGAVLAAYQAAVALRDRGDYLY